MRERIGIFGGSFDPVHAGHLFIAAQAREQAELQRVLFLPCHQSPHKNHAATAAHHRLAMLELALESCPWAEISQIELLRPPPSFSHLSVRELSLMHPNAEWYWLLGEDQWHALPTWREAEWLAQQLHFIVFSRHNAPTPRPGYRMQALEGIHPASSSSIRAHSHDPSWLPEKVASYIAHHGLYL